MQKIYLFIFSLLSTVSFIHCGNWQMKPPTNELPTNNGEQNVVFTPNEYINIPYIAPPYDLGAELKKVKNNYFATKAFALKNGYNQDFVFVIDMRIPNYKKRFFVYNAKKDSLLNIGFVAHGIGSETFKGSLIFSNIPNSKCSSLGKYAIGESYNGAYGFSYRLRGLDSTNNKALERAVVLHSYYCVPDAKEDEGSICFSYGCPMVSEKFLQILKGYISKQGKKPILLSIFY